MRQVEVNLFVDNIASDSATCAIIPCGIDYKVNGESLELKSGDTIELVHNSKVIKQVTLTGVGEHVSQRLKAHNKWCFGVSWVTPESKPSVPQMCGLHRNDTEAFHCALFGWDKVYNKNCSSGFIILCFDENYKTDN